MDCGGKKQNQSAACAFRICISVFHCAPRFEIPFRAVDSCTRPSVSWAGLALIPPHCMPCDSLGAFLALHCRLGR